ncbi:MAG: sigma-70 family RNA polymerase sigma factor [Candidatus Peribacteraceae bacterium]|jgi:RNA polymerase sigma-70 factor (ECF subfamily)
MDPSALPELVSLSQQGNTEAFGKIYDHFFPSVYRYTAVRVPEQVTEDLVAEIFVKAWEKISTYKERKDIPFGAWLFRIARNTVVDTYRSHRSWDEIPENLSDPDELNRADSRTRRSYVLTGVRKAMQELPPRYREVLSLCYLAERNNSEVAAILKISEGSLRILKFRALKKLKELLPEEIMEIV